MEAYGITVFCEDIRNEISGQKTLIGVFEQTLYLPAFPIIVPKLSLQVYIVVPQEQYPNTFELRVYFPGDDGDKPSFKMAHNLDPFDPEKMAKSKVDHTSDVDKVHKFTQSAVFSPVQIKQEGLIKVRVHCDDQVIKAGILHVESAASISSSAMTPGAEAQHQRP